MFEDDRVHGSVLSLEDQLGWHQGTLGHADRKRDTRCVGVGEALLLIVSMDGWMLVIDFRLGNYTVAAL